MDALETARFCAKYADDKKAENIVLLDLRGLSPVTDYFVICTAGSSPQLRAVRDEIVVQMRQEQNVKPLIVDGSFESQWMIVNFPNVLVHILSPEKREYYSLEELWGDAPTVPWQSEEPEPEATVHVRRKPAAKKKPAAAKKTAAKKATVKKAPAKKAAAKKKSSK